MGGATIGDKAGIVGAEVGTPVSEICEMLSGMEATPERLRLVCVIVKFFLSESAPDEHSCGVHAGRSVLVHRRLAEIFPHQTKDLPEGVRQQILGTVSA